MLIHVGLTKQYNMMKTPKYKCFHHVIRIFNKDKDCGVFVGKIDKTKINMEKLDDVIRDHVPAGTNVHRDAERVPILD